MAEAMEESQDVHREESWKGEESSRTLERWKNTVLRDTDGEVRVVMIDDRSLVKLAQ